MTRRTFTRTSLWTFNPWRCHSRPGSNPARNSVTALRLYARSINMKNFFLQIFTWWNGQTLGTRFFTWRKGQFVGEDSFGNRYYRTRDERKRWVTYKGVADPTTVPPEWHGWLHHTVDVAPAEQVYKPKPWQKPHRPNMTGTPQAIRPSGSIARSGQRPRATGDYEPWSPE